MWSQQEVSEEEKLGFTRPEASLPPLLCFFCHSSRCQQLRCVHSTTATLKTVIFYLSSETIVAPQMEVGSKEVSLGKKMSLWTNSWAATVRERGVIQLGEGEGGFCLVDRGRKLSLSWREGQQVYLTVSEGEKVLTETQRPSPVILLWFSSSAPPSRQPLLYFTAALQTVLYPTFSTFFLCGPGFVPEEELWFLQLLWILQRRFAHGDMLNLWGRSYTTPPTTNIYYLVHLHFFFFSSEPILLLKQHIFL